MSTPIGSLVVYDPQEAIPAPDGFTATVDMSNPSHTAQRRAAGVRGNTLVVWSPERGWTCQEHGAQPCIHTAGLNPPGLPQELQP